MWVGGKNKRKKSDVEANVETVQQNKEWQKHSTKVEKGKRNQVEDREKHSV